jgi:hypothetical protein
MHFPYFCNETRVTPNLHNIPQYWNRFQTSKSIRQKTFTYSHVLHPVYWVVRSPRPRCLQLFKTRMFLRATWNISWLRRISWQLHFCVGQILISTLAVWATLPIIFHIGAPSQWPRGLRHGCVLSYSSYITHKQRYKEVAPWRKKNITQIRKF